MEDVRWLDPVSARVFATTRWSVINACSQTNEAQAHAALSELCQAYWQPIYCCVRHHGHSEHDSQDLTQEFFQHFLRGAWLEHLDESRGRFRSYLSKALQNFLRKRWRRMWTLRRGRGCTMIPIEAADAEESYAFALATQTTPESLYERQWARVVIEQTLRQLRIEMQVAGKEPLFDHFDAILRAETRDFPYEQLSGTMNLKVNAVHGALHRWRQRYRALMREEVARTVASKAEIEDELLHLQRVFARPD